MDNEMPNNLPLDSTPPKGVSNLFGISGKNCEIEVEQIEPLKTELILQSDQLATLKRRVLIGIHAYGQHNLSQVAAFAGLSFNQLRKLLEEKDLQEAIKSGTVPCWTKAELISRLCTITDTSSKDTDKLTAIKMLLEFRGLSNPEGGSRDFKRIIQRYKQS